MSCLDRFNCRPIIIISPSNRTGLNLSYSAAIRAYPRTCLYSQGDNPALIGLCELRCMALLQARQLSAVASEFTEHAGASSVMRLLLWIESNSTLPSHLNTHSTHELWPKICFYPQESHLLNSEPTTIFGVNFYFENKEYIGSEKSNATCYFLLERFE